MVYTGQQQKGNASTLHLGYYDYMAAQPTAPSEGYVNFQFGGRIEILKEIEITDEEKSWIINIACQKPVDLGYSAETWTYSKLTKHINETAESAGYIRLLTITKTSIKNILDAAEIKPFRIQYYCENRDPDFEAKMYQVLVVYKQLELLFDENGELYIPAGEQEVHTVSYDEKPGIQAIATTSPDLKPNIENGTIKRDYEYKRLGTISLLAAIDLLTGEEIPLVRNTHNSDDFIDFLKFLDERYAAGDTIQVILDIHSDGVKKGQHLVTDVDGKPTAQIMFFNGLSYLNAVGAVDYLKNDNLQGNLAFSFQLQKVAEEYFPGYARKIYLKGYRYNLHLLPKSVVIEVGAQTNTLQEELNAMEPLAFVLNKVLRGE